MSTISYIGKAVGCFPKELPASELLGNRGTNELTSLTFNYTVSDFREITYREVAGSLESDSGPPDYQLQDELEKNVLSKYGQKPYFDPTVGLIEDLAGKLGGMLGGGPLGTLAKSVGAAADDAFNTGRKF